MSTTAARVGQAADARRSPVRAVTSWLEAQALLVTPVIAVAVFSIAKLSQHITQDSWLALIGGRYVAAHGIPHHDTLYVITHGTRWIDQQWLAQLAIYGLYQVGGLALYGLVYVALTIAGFAMTIGAARALGGSERHVVWTLPLAGALYFAGTFNVRTQGFALPLFSATLWLLAREMRGTRDRRVYLVFPMLVVWGNLHGSVTLGVGLAMLCGAIQIGQQLTDGRWRNPLRHISRRGMLLLVGAPICLLINPYGLTIVSYYRETLFNPAFGKVVTEWQPITTITVLAVPCFLLALAVVLVIGRAGRRMPLFEQLALLVLCGGAIFAIRNITWFGMGVTMLLPATLTTLFGAGKTSDRRPAINLSLAVVVILVLVATTAATAARPASWFERSYDPSAIATVRGLAAQDPAARIYADNRFADWLLWEDPQLAGRIAYDIRFELLTTGELQRILDVTALPAPGETPLLNGYRILALDPQGGGATQRLLARPGTHVVLRNSRIVIATWAPVS